MTVSSHPLIGDAQQQLAGRVRDRLRQVGAQFVERVLTYPVEVTIEFRPEVREPERLAADISVGCDGFWFIANAAALHLEMQDAGNDPDGWVELCDRTLHAVLTHDLRIRVRRTLLGRRTGAVWVPLDAGGWNGEYLR